MMVSWYEFIRRSQVKEANPRLSPGHTAGLGASRRRFPLSIAAPAQERIVGLVESALRQAALRFIFLLGGGGGGGFYRQKKLTMGSVAFRKRETLLFIIGFQGLRPSSELARCYQDQAIFAISTTWPIHSSRLGMAAPVLKFFMLYIL